MWTSVIVVTGGSEWCINRVTWDAGLQHKATVCPALAPARNRHPSARPPTGLLSPTLSQWFEFYTPYCHYSLPSITLPTRY